MSRRPVKIATAQSRVSSDVRDNGREVRRLMQEARSAGSAIVHFSEAAASGCSKADIKGWDRFDWGLLV
jgi:deaminated glutathione amidase